MRLAAQGALRRHRMAGRGPEAGLVAQGVDVARCERAGLQDSDASSAPELVGEPEDAPAHIIRDPHAAIDETRDERRDVFYQAVRLGFEQLAQRAPDPQARACGSQRSAPMRCR